MCQKIYSLFVFKVLKIKEKESNWELAFDLHLYYYLEFFPRDFLCDFDFQTLYFLTLELSIYPIYYDLFFGEKIGVWFSERTKSYKPSFI